MMKKLALVSWTLGLTQVDAMMYKVLQHGLDQLRFGGDHTGYDAAGIMRSSAAKGVRIVCVAPMHCKPPVPAAASAAAAIAYYRGVVQFAAEYNALEAAGFDGIVAVELVLPELTPGQPPWTPGKRARLDSEIARSVAVWNAPGTTAMPAGSGARAGSL